MDGQMDGLIDGWSKERIDQQKWSCSVTISLQLLDLVCFAVISKVEVTRENGAEYFLMFFLNLLLCLLLLLLLMLFYFFIIILFVIIINAIIIVIIIYYYYYYYYYYCYYYYYYFSFFINKFLLILILTGLRKVIITRIIQLKYFLFAIKT